MALVLADRVKETSNTTGTGTFVLAGPSTGFQSFAVVGNANTTYYTIQNPGTNEWEVGVGTYYSANTSIVRTTVFSSSNANSVVSFSSGVKDVFVTYPAERAVYYEAAGGVNIFENSASTALVVTQAGSGNAFVVEDSTSPDSSPFVITSAGDVGVGTATPTVAVDIATTNSGIINTRYASFALSPATVDLRKSASATIGTNTLVTNGNEIGRISFSGADGSTYRVAASISANVDGVSGASDMPGRLTFNTTADGDFAVTERMRIDNAGRVGIGTSSLQTGTVLTVGGISSLGRDGANGYIQAVGGGTTNTGYLGFYTSADVRQAYIGYIGAPNDALNIETDAGSNKPIRFATNAATRMTIASTGNVTINTYLTANLTTTTSGPFDSGTGATWTNPRTIATWAQIELWGAGGGGGGSASGGAGGGGGGGAYFTITVPFSYLGTTETYTVGGGGANVSTNTNGGAGGNTTFTVSNWPGGSKTFTVYGGGGGGGASSTAAYAGGGGGGVLGVGGSAASATIGQGGAPLSAAQTSGNGNEGYGGAAGSSAVATQGGSAYYGGGGGGCGENGTGTGVTGLGGNSIYGGGGGGGGNDSGTVRCPGGTSVFGGKGGDGGYGNNTTAAQNGTVPGGGGGGSDLGTAGSGNGASGRVLVTIW